MQIVWSKIFILFKASSFFIFLIWLHFNANLVTVQITFQILKVFKSLSSWMLKFWVFVSLCCNGLSAFQARHSCIAQLCWYFWKSLRIKCWKTFSEMHLFKCFAKFFFKGDKMFCIRISIWKVHVSNLLIWAAIKLAQMLAN